MCAACSQSFDASAPGSRNAAVAVSADTVHDALKLTGRGVRIAVLDTGIDVEHPDLRDAVVAQHCFTQGDCPPSRSDESSQAQDDNGHGSHVAGIIAARGLLAGVGVAPGAELIAVKVSDHTDSGVESDWVAGLSWIYDNRHALGVRLVNISVASDALYDSAQPCDPELPALAEAVQHLVAAGVAVFAASGNRGSPTALSAPACITGVVSVGAVYDADAGNQPADAPSYAARWGERFAACRDRDAKRDQIACFTNSSQRLDLAAPGTAIVSDDLMGSTAAYWGTSQACPVATGVAALMLECNPTLAPADIKRVLVRTGRTSVDSKNRLEFPTVRALPAVLAACPELQAKLPAAGMSDAHYVDAAYSGEDTLNHRFAAGR